MKEREYATITASSKQAKKIRKKGWGYAGLRKSSKWVLQQL